MLQRIANLLRVQPPVADNRGLLSGSGDTVPGAVDGWQIGAIFQHTDGTDGTALYVNEGSVTSASFVAVDTAPGEDAGQIIFATTATAPLIDINGSYDDQFIETGTYQSTADGGIVVSSTNNRPVSFLFDDGGDVFAAPGDIRAGLFRLLLTVDQTAAVTLNALRAQIKANNLVDITSANAVTSPFTGYIELDGAGAKTLNGHVACIRAALETGAGAHTVGTILAGFEATLNSSGSFTADKLFAFAANISSGTTQWQVGYKVVDDSCDTGVSVGACTGAGVAVTGAWGAGYDTAGILIAADQAGAAIALGSSASGWCIVKTNVTAAATAGSYIFGEYVTIATSATMVDGFIMGKYVKVNLAHVAYENYAIRGRMCVDVAQTGDTGNQYLGVFGAVEFAAGAHAIRATGGGYGVLGTASIASGGTLDQPLIGGYFECNAVDNIAGITTASRHRMLGYCDYGVDVLCQTTNNVAGIRVNPDGSAKLDLGILFEGTSAGNITHAFKFAAND